MMCTFDHFSNKEFRFLNLANVDDIWQNSALLIKMGLQSSKA